MDGHENDEKTWLAIEGTINWIKENRNINMAVKYYSDKYGIDEDIILQGVKDYQSIHPVLQPAETTIKQDENKKCDICGQPIINRYGSKYCSFKCIQEHEATKKKVKAQQKHKDIKRIKVQQNKECIVCGKEIEGRYRNAIYCSRKCSRDDYARKSIKKITSRANRMAKPAKTIAKIYGCKCALCGWGLSIDGHYVTSKDGEVQWTNGCEVHHIIPVRENGDESLENLILLCPNCHKRADKGLLDRYMLTIIAKYIINNAEMEKINEQGKKKAVGSLDFERESEVV